LLSRVSPVMAGITNPEVAHENENHFAAGPFTGSGAAKDAVTWPIETPRLPLCRGLLTFAPFTMKLIARLSLLAVTAFVFTFTAASHAATQYDLPATDDGLPGTGPIRRADWFKKLWMQKRYGWAMRGNKDEGALVFLGDSITQGWGEDMGHEFREAKVANRGISGDTTRGVLISRRTRTRRRSRET
jgi:hypothetical protein